MDRCRAITLKSHETVSEATDIKSCENNFGMIDILYAEYAEYAVSDMSLLNSLDIKDFK